MRQSEKGGRVKKRTARGRPPTNDPRPVVLSPSTLRRLPLPQPDADGDKEERGRVLIVGGAPEMPG
ncbi:MAG: hypothetical protein M3R15_34250, partial [Acidobacteriota bacterium]|nr:hypothetical protein [Acidobacteriota bacterium]